MDRSKKLENKWLRVLAELGRKKQMLTRTKGFRNVRLEDSEQNGLS